MARALADMGYTDPTPIQEQVVPLVRNGRDLVGQAQTGTGKTAAFGIPLVEKLDPSVGVPQALVLTPTRELAKQVHGEITRLGKYRRVQGVTVYGGQAMSRQLTALERGVQVIVATPGRLMDHMYRGTMDLRQHLHRGAGRGGPDAGHRVCRGHRVHTSICTQANGRRCYSRPPCRGPYAIWRDATSATRNGYALAATPSRWSRWRRSIMR